MARAKFFMSLVLSMAACTGGESPEALTVTATGQAVQGTFRSGGESLTFKSTEVEPQVFDIVVEVNGMTLSALIDGNRQVAEMDGFAGTGEDTQILDADRALLGGLFRALDTDGQLNTGEVTAASLLRRVASHWSETPDTVPLQRQVAGSQDRDWTSLCAYYGKYVNATHDDGTYARNAPNSTSSAKVGTRTASTYYYVNKKWTKTVQDHQPNMSEYGECYGNCGYGCPTGNQTLTLDCHDHDQCTRNGHLLASLYCDDEFTDAIDDKLFAPTCSGT